MGYINNAFINTIDANIIARRNMHTLENYIYSLIIKKKCSFELEKKELEEIKEIYDNFTQELEEESECGLARDYKEITNYETATENQIKMIYYKLRQHKEKLSFTDADLIIKILCDYNKEEN